MNGNTISTFLAGAVVLAVVAVVVKSSNSAGIVSAFGGAFSNVLASASGGTVGSSPNQSTAVTTRAQLV